MLGYFWRSFNEKILNTETNLTSFVYTFVSPNLNTVSYMLNKST